MYVDSGKSMVIARAELLCDEAIYRRTTAGQREVIFDHAQLPPMARRFLLLVNGETPLRDLLDLLQLQGEHVGEAVLQLIDSGLIEMRLGAPRLLAQRQKTAEAAQPAQRAHSAL
jgi:hypothetical protein